MTSPESPRCAVDGFPEWMWDTEQKKWVRHDEVLACGFVPPKDGA